MVSIRKIHTYWLVAVSLAAGFSLPAAINIELIKFGDLLTIASIFIGFYLTLLISINGKIFSIEVKSTMPIEQRLYIKRYLKYSNDFVMLVYYGFISILISMILYGICNIDSNDVLSYISEGVFFTAVSFFALSLIKIIIILIDFFKEDFRQKYSITLTEFQQNNDE